MSAQRVEKRRRSSRKSVRFQRYKIASLPILLLVLVYVLFSNQSDDEAPRSPVTANSSGSVVDDLVREKLHSLIPWPNVELDFLHDPSPLASYTSRGETATSISATSQQTAEQQEDELTQVSNRLSEQPFRYSFHSNKQNIIMLGDQVLSKGDVVADTPSASVQDIKEGRLIIKVQKADSQPEGNSIE